MDSDPEIKMSHLCCSLESEGTTVSVDIYEGDEGGWILEVVDEFNNSTIWDDEFPTDQAALDEVKRTIEKDGICVLSGPVDDSEFPPGTERS